MAKSRYNNSEKIFREFGNRIQELRKTRGWTQEDMADKGFSYRFYQRIEAGKPIHFKTVLKIASVFDLSLKDLFKDL